MRYHDFTVRSLGERASQREHDSTALVRGAVEVFRDLLERHGMTFRVPIPIPAFRHIELQWTSEGSGAAIATFWSRRAAATTSGLVSGRDPAADREVLTALQQSITQILKQTPVEPAFELLQIAERPAIITVPWPMGLGCPDIGMIADMETCLAAAYFECLQEDAK